MCESRAARIEDLTLEKLEIVGLGLGLVDLLMDLPPCWMIDLATWRLGHGLDLQPPTIELVRLWTSCKMS